MLTVKGTMDFRPDGTGKYTQSKLRPYGFGVCGTFPEGQEELASRPPGEKRASVSSIK